MFGDQSHKQVSPDQSQGCEKKEEQTSALAQSDQESEQNLSDHKEKPMQLLNIDIQKEILSKHVPIFVTQDHGVIKYLVAEGISQEDPMKHLAATYVYWEEWSADGKFIRKVANEYTGKKVKLFLPTDQQIEGLHYAISTMKAKEVGWFFISSAYHRPLPKVQKPSHTNHHKAPSKLTQEEQTEADLQQEQKQQSQIRQQQSDDSQSDKFYKIMLLRYENEKQKVCFEDYTKQAESRRELGNEQFSYKNYDEAIKSYQQAFSIMNSVPNDIKKNLSEEQIRSIRSLQIKYLNNKCVCFLKLRRYVQVEQVADKVLELDQNNFKAQFNKGTALTELQYYDRAIEIYQRLSQADPGNPDIGSIIQVIQSKIKKQSGKSSKMKERNVYRRMLFGYSDESQEPESTQSEEHDRRQKLVKPNY